jgi:transaldolase/glucose-6-phosphate isomerase
MTEATTLGPASRIPAELREQVAAALARSESERWVSRIWAHDPTIWTADERVAGLISQRLGWLDAPQMFRERVEELEAYASGVRAEGFDSVLVCGMGGSSLAPEVLARASPLGELGIPVRILDSTDPAAVRSAQSASDPLRTLYLIASKSGTTTETLAFLAHFWHVEDELHADIPASAAAQHFGAITDPGRLKAIPHSDLFGDVFINPADVGGRYSALTYVGLVPAALLGLDLRGLLDDAVLMAERCREPEARNPGLSLGVTLGALALAGRDKLTLAIEPRRASFGAWVEQLIAESTGKRGLGIVPIDGEPLGEPGVYGDDRVFVRVFSGSDDQEWLRSTGVALDALAEAGHPVIDISLADGEGVGGEFFRWEFATAVCGAVLGVDPFDEPNVTESKENTLRVLEDFRDTGRLPADEVLISQPPLTLVGDAPLRLTEGHTDVAAELARHLERVRPNSYLGLQAYILATPERDAALSGIAQLLRDRTRRAVTVGYGPRFLHSTGQLHKGGPPTGCFIQLVADHPDDLPIPGHRESFGTLIDAQAAGDFRSLESHELPVLRVHLSADPDAGLDALRTALEKTLG